MSFLVRSLVALALSCAALALLVQPGPTASRNRAELSSFSVWSPFEASEPVVTTTTTEVPPPPTEVVRQQATPTAPVTAPARVWPVSYAPCGGDYPPCSVVEIESHGNYNAYNPTGCGGLGCFGKWQFAGSWAGKLGLPLDLSQATPEQQDNAARLLWNQGAGCGNWNACS